MIKIVNEEDRLSMNAHFIKGDKVELILSDNEFHKAYNVIVSPKPYTALCIDIYATDETDRTIEVNKYINKEGLDGEHLIYLKINDTLYNTGLTIDFNRWRFTPPKAKALEVGDFFTKIC